MDRLVKKGSRSWSLVRGLTSEERIWVAGAWFMDRPVKKGSRFWSLVRGSAGEERIWVVGAWFMDRLVMKGYGSPELGSWIGR